MRAATALPAPKVHQMNPWKARASSAKIGVRYPADKTRDSRIAAVCAQPGRYSRWAELCARTVMATDTRSRSNARPGNPVGNMRNSRCMIGRVRQVRLKASGHPLPPSEHSGQRAEEIPDIGNDRFRFLPSPVVPSARMMTLLLEVVIALNPSTRRTGELRWQHGDAGRSLDHGHAPMHRLPRGVRRFIVVTR